MRNRVAQSAVNKFDTLVLGRFSVGRGVRESLIPRTISCFSMFIRVKQSIYALVWQGYEAYLYHVSVGDCVRVFYLPLRAQW